MLSMREKKVHQSSFCSSLEENAPRKLHPELMKDSQVSEKSRRFGVSKAEQRAVRLHCLNQNTYLWAASTYKPNFPNLAKPGQACRYTSWARTGQADWTRICRGLLSTLFMHLCPPLLMLAQLFHVWRNIFRKKNNKKSRTQMKVDILQPLHNGVR